MTAREPTIALAIPHAIHKPERVASLERLLDALGFMKPPTGEGPLELLLVTERCHFTKWATDMWRWLEDSGADWGLQLQDDTLVAPNFWRAFRAMLASGTVPERDVICLEAAHDFAPLIHVCGDPWYTTSDMLIGNAYAARHTTLRDFRDFREQRLKPGAFSEGKEAITEDTLFGIFCLVTNRKIWCPTRTIVDHDLAIPSTCGNDAHPNRRPQVRWDNVKIPLERFEDPAYWRPTKRVPHVGRGYGLTPAVAKQWVKDLSEEDFARMVADDGVQEKTRLKAEVRIILPPEATPTVVVATPCRGNPSAHYMATVWAVRQRGIVEVVQPYEHSAWWLWRNDIVRVRSRMVAQFLKSGRSHLWFLDDDVSCDPAVLQGMLRTGRDFVMCPYPSKAIDWSSVAREDDRSAEARGMKFDQIEPIDGADRELDEMACVEIAAGGLGCALISRAGLLKLIAWMERQASLPEGEDLRCGDPIAGDMFALFAMRFRERLEDGKTKRDLLSEDLSFCARWRESGQKVWMYVGPGSPATHHGEYAFRGLPQSLRPGQPVKPYEDDADHPEDIPGDAA